MNPRLLRTLILLVYLGVVSVISPVLAAQKHSLIRTGTLPLQFTATVPETLTTSLQVTVPAGATSSTLMVNCFDCDHTDWGSLSINGRTAIALWPGPGPSNASGMIRISVPVSAWRTGSNTLAFTHSQYLAGRVDALSVTFTTTTAPSPPATTTVPTTPPSTSPTTAPSTPPTTSPTSAPSTSATLPPPGTLPLQFTATVPETFTTSLQVTVPAGATGSTLSVNCFDCDHTDWGSLSINGGAGIALWPGPGPSNASGMIRIFVPVSAWRTGSNTLAFTHSQYLAGRVDALSVAFTTTTAPSPATTTVPTTPPSTSPTTAPSTPPTTSPTSAPPPSSTPLVSTSGSATLSWTLGTEPGLAGYNVYVGTSSGVYNYPGSPFNAAVVNTYTMSNLPKGQTYFFAISAYDTAGNKSGLSAEVSKSIY